MRNLWLNILIISLQFVANHAFGQCCSPGNPIGGLSGLGTNPADTWQFFLNYRYGYSGAYFEGNKESDTRFIESGNFSHIGLIASLGLTEKLTVEAETGYFLNKTQMYVPGIIPEKLVGRGLTDLILSVRYQIWREPISDWEITSGAGIKIPAGSYQKKYEGALLTRDLQPTTGSYDFIHSLFLYKGFLGQKLRAFLATRLEIKGLNPDKYRYGNFLMVSGFASWSPGIRWILVGQIRSEFRGRDTRLRSGSGIPVGDDREIVIPTGSAKVFFVPQITYSFSQETFLSLLVDLPLYQYYHDKQLASTTALTLSLRHTLGPARFSY